MCKTQIIEPATTDWASLVVIVPKHDESHRLSIGYRTLDVLTIRVTNLLPQMDECIDVLEMEWYSRHMKSGGIIG